MWRSPALGMGLGDDVKREAGLSWVTLHVPLEYCSQAGASKGLEGKSW